jgi:hypothetical protein
MDGLLLKLNHDQTGAPGRWFWQLFEPIRQDLDRLFWCLPEAPWMGSSDEFREDDFAEAPFTAAGFTTTMLWRPGTLGRYAERFAEEFIELWGIDPAMHDPQRVASQYDAASVPEMTRVILPYAQVRLIYLDSSSWEIYSRNTELLHRVRGHLSGKTWVKAFEGDVEHRDAVLRAAGLNFSP